MAESLSNKPANPFDGKVLRIRFFRIPPDIPPPAERAPFLAITALARLAATRGEHAPPADTGYHCSPPGWCSSRCVDSALVHRVALIAPARQPPADHLRTLAIRQAGQPCNPASSCPVVCSMALPTAQHQPGVGGLLGQWGAFNERHPSELARPRARGTLGYPHCEYPRWKPRPSRTRNTPCFPVL